MTGSLFSPIVKFSITQINSPNSTLCRAWWRQLRELQVPAQGSPAHPGTWTVMLISLCSMSPKAIPLPSLDPSPAARRAAGQAARDTQTPSLGCCTWQSSPDGNWEQHHTIPSALMGARATGKGWRHLQQAQLPPSTPTAYTARKLISNSLTDL